MKLVVKYSDSIIATSVPTRSIAIFDSEDNIIAERKCEYPLEYEKYKEIFNKIVTCVNTCESA